MDSNHSDTTISLELSAEEVGALAHACETASPLARASRTPDVRSPGTFYETRRTALLVCVALTVAFVGTIGYLARAGVPTPEANTHRTVDPPAPPPAPEPPAPEGPPVRFANPFDRTEVFEFPAGTNSREAREAVAEILLKRAEERGFRKSRTHKTAPPPR